MKKSVSAFGAAKIMLIACLTVGALFAAGCRETAGEAVKPTIETVIADKTLAPAEKAAKLTALLSVEEKVGQMVMIGIAGTELNDDSRYLLNEFNFGGVVLFDRNMVDKKQVAALNAALQKQAGTIPLLIAVDEEGGMVSRMTDEIGPPPAAEAIGATGDPAQAARWAKYTAAELKALGFNLNFAPVADVGAPDGRSYGDDPAAVAAFLRAAVKSYRQENFLCTLKHFPGLGRGEGDTHEATVKVAAARDELMAADVAPFREIIKTANHSDFLVMVSHLVYPAFDENPASLSKPVITDLLRQELGFGGVVITDDLEMGAISDNYGFADAAARAVEAGADIVLVCHEYEHEIAAYNGILKAVRSGKIPAQRLDESVRRILLAKLKHL